MRDLVIISALLALQTAPAAANPIPASGNQALLGCARMEEDKARLDCYDNVVSSLSDEAKQLTAQREAAAAKAAAQAQAAQAARKADNFGSEALRDGRNREETAEEVTANLSEILKDASGKMLFVLDNGQIWRQADSYKLRGVKIGAAVKIRRGAMGSYRLVPEGTNRNAQVIRMR